MTFNEQDKAVLEKLKTGKGESQLSLLAKIYGYRVIEGKLLYFSVKERALLQDKRFDECNDFLLAVIENADKENHIREAKNIPKDKRKRQREKIKQELSLVEPPKERTVARNKPDSIIDSTLRLMGRSDFSLPLRSTLNEQFAQGLAPLLEAQRMAGIAQEQLKVGNELAAAFAHLTKPPALSYLDSALSQPPIEYVTIEGHAYHDTVNELEVRLSKYPKIIWTKMSIERECIKDENLMAQVQKRRQRIRRAVTKLINNNVIFQTTTGDETLYYRIQEEES